MEVTVKVFANFREEVGQKTIDREYEDASTVGEVLDALSAEYPGVELFEDDGSLAEYITVLRDGEDVTHIDGVDTALDGGETLSLFPPVAGG